MASALDDAAMIGTFFEGAPREDLTVPTWWWYGDTDRMVPPSHARWFSQRIPHATLIVRPGEGHGRTIFGHWVEMFSALGTGPPAP